jgi:hypothetical protein
MTAPDCVGFAPRRSYVQRPSRGWRCVSAGAMGSCEGRSKRPYGWLRPNSGKQGRYRPARSHDLGGRFRWSGALGLIGCGPPISQGPLPAQSA